jgi:hypothetical protein
MDRSLAQNSLLLLISSSFKKLILLVAIALTCCYGFDASAQATASPSSVTWVSVAIGQAGGQKVVTLSNTGNTTITISSIGFKGSDPGDFSIYQKTCGSTLPASSSCTTTILFKPTVAGTRTATLVFTDTASNSPQQVSVSGTGTTATASITVNFGSRSNSQIAIPANMLGTEYFENLPTNANRSTLIQAGFRNERYRLQVPLIFPNGPTAPNWTRLDSDMQKFVAARLTDPGVHALIELEYTPTFLQPSPLPCPSNPTASVPTNVNEWGKLVAAIAAHLDHNFPGVAQYYEIWNEPNTGGLCSSNKLADYERIYAAAAPQIQAQGQKDGIRLYTGGPAAADVAFTDILTNASTARYVDFYSYHFYVANGVDINEGMTWTGAGGKPSLYSMIPSLQRQYLLADAAVKSATTPLGAHTPIFHDEYNEDWVFTNDCCRNSPIYSPLYNSMVVALILNSVYQGANELPSRLTYYAANQPTFCILGVLDTSMDCAHASTGTAAQPYPQWYTYKLIFTRSYLDLMDGGHVASSVTLSSAASSEGIIATAYYTPTMDSILVINPTASSFSGITLQINNSGFSSPTSSAHIINASNPQLSAWPVTTTSSSGGLKATFNLPAYSVVAISLK